MLKYLRRVKMEFNALDPRMASCLELLAQCNSRKAKESNLTCSLLVKRRTDDAPPKITVTFANGVDEVFDAAANSAEVMREMILEKGQYLENERMFATPASPGPSSSPPTSSTIRRLIPSRRKQKRRSSNYILLDPPSTWEHLSII